MPMPRDAHAPSHTSAADPRPVSPSRRAVLGAAAATLPLLAMRSGTASAAARPPESTSARAAWAGRVAPRPSWRDQSYGTKAIASARWDGVCSTAGTPGSLRLVSTQLLSRHGARALSSAYYCELGLAMTASAQDMGSLTASGARFRDVVARMQAADAQLGWGNLSGRGHQQMRDMGAVLASRADGLVPGRRTWLVESSGEPRATASATDFVAGASGVRPDLALGAVVPNTSLLYFHKSNAAYNDYVAHDPDLAAATARLDATPTLLEAQRVVLGGILGRRFVQALEAGSVDLRSSDGRNKVASLADAASIVYGLYSIAPSLSVEGPFDLTPWLPGVTASVLGWWSDGHDFYEKGPSLCGRTQTFAMARVLLADFLDRAGDPSAGDPGSLGGVLRFSHAEEVIPFLALLKVPGSDRQLPLDAPFSYRATGWFGAAQSPLGATVVWQVFEDRRGVRWVRMLHNGRATSFKPGVPDHGRQLYRLDDLRRAYQPELAG